MTTEFDTIIASECERLKLDPTIVSALILIESSGNPWAWNPEPRYRYFWNVRTNRPFRKITEEEIKSEAAPMDFPTLKGDRDQEWWGQQASWGLMQVMGAVAREHGFNGKYLTQLCDSEMNIHYGCQHLALIMRGAKGDLERALATYNGGRVGNVERPFRNQFYADKVLLQRHQLGSSR